MKTDIENVETHNTESTEAPPRMPVAPIVGHAVHHEKESGEPVAYPVCVAEPINIGEALRIPDAIAAIQKEWDKLSNQECWLVNTVRERSDVKNVASSSSDLLTFSCVHLHSSSWSDVWFRRGCNHP